MCFIKDYDGDWTARVSETDDFVAIEPVRCGECRSMIPVGDRVNHLHQQEYLTCACEEEACDCEGDDHSDCACDGYGEEFDIFWCDDCRRFLDCINEVEVEAGCSGNETTPVQGEMTESIRDGGTEEAKKYFQLALRRFPDMKPYLGRLWNRMFV